MYICVCRGVNEKDLKEAHEQGLDSLAKLQREMGIGTACGSCIEHTLNILKKISNTSKKLGRISIPCSSYEKQGSAAAS